MYSSFDVNKKESWCSVLVFLLTSSSVLFLMFTFIKIKECSWCWWINISLWMHDSFSGSAWFLTGHEYLPVMHEFARYKIFLRCIISVRHEIFSRCIWNRLACIVFRSAWVLTCNARSSAMQSIDARCMIYDACVKSWCMILHDACVLTRDAWFSMMHTSWLTMHDIPQCLSIDSRCMNNYITSNDDNGKTSSR